MFTSTGIPASTCSKRFVVILIFAAALSQVSCGHTQAAAPIPMDTVMQAVHDYGKGHQPNNARAKTVKVHIAASAEEFLNDSDGSYQINIATMLGQSDFASLEKEAQKVRADKSRLHGGTWKIFGFYEGAGKLAAGSPASESDWEAHFTILKKWVAAYPESATAHIALAQAYIEYAWAARGTGYAESVSGSGWDSFGERIGMAKKTLLETAKLKEKCPYWYEAMQTVALAEGWDKAQARELFDQAVAFQPDYYHYYREYAYYLLPKWYGEEGETQAFAEDVAARLSEPDASITYFEIAGLRACQCDSERDSLEGMSWPRVKQGYEKLVGLYGSSDLKLNRYAYMAYLANDQLSAKRVFPTIRENWSRRVWRDEQHYEVARAWAEGGAGN